MALHQHPGHHKGIVLNYCQYGVLYLGSYYNTGPYIHFPHFGTSNLGKLPQVQSAYRQAAREAHSSMRHCVSGAGLKV